jgi:hypothetical protein
MPDQKPITAVPGAVYEVTDHRGCGSTNCGFLYIYTFGEVLKCVKATKTKALFMRLDQKEGMYINKKVYETRLKLIKHPKGQLNLQ